MAKIPKYFENIASSLALLFSIVVSINHVGFLPELSPVVVAGCAILCVAAIIVRGNCRLQKRSLWFIAFLPLTILFAQPDPVFQSWLRLAVYTAIFAIGSPLIQNNYARRFRRKSLVVICCFCIFIGVGSFIAYFLGYSAQAERAIAAGIDTNLYDVGHFSGIARQSMSLGPLAGIGAMTFVYLALTRRNMWYYLGAIPCVGSVMFSASRVAFVATIIGAVFILHKFASSRMKFVKYLATASVCGILTFPIWGEAMSGLAEKQANHEDDTSIFDSRAQKVECRTREFISSPVWGVGFSAINPNLGDKFDRERGVIEPGSSWLAILSMTGVIGFVLFLRMYIRSYMVMKASEEAISVLLISIFILISVHMLAEGYIFATGNPLCYYVALFLGCGYDLIHCKKEEK